VTCGTPEAFAGSLEPATAGCGNRVRLAPCVLAAVATPVVTALPALAAGKGQPVQGRARLIARGHGPQRHPPVAGEDAAGVPPKGAHAEIAILSYPWSLPKTAGCFDTMPIAPGDVPYLCEPEGHASTTRSSARARRLRSPTTSIRVRRARRLPAHR
jgi:hypothetical protein